MTRIWVPGYEEVLDLFERYKQQDKKVERAKERLMSACWKQTSYIKRDPIRSYQDAPALQKYIEMREDLNAELIRQVEKIRELQKQIFEMLDLVDHPHKTILYMYYVLDYSWVKISSELNYNADWCTQIRNTAIAKIAQSINSRMAKENNKG